MDDTDRVIQDVMDVLSRPQGSIPQDLGVTSVVTSLFREPEQISK